MNLYPQVLRNRPYLMLGLAAGLLVGFLSPAALKPTARVLPGWDTAIWVYLVLIWSHMAFATEEHVRTHAQREDENAGAVMFVICVNIAASMVGN
jgi:uncharacterized membrane protein